MDWYLAILQQFTVFTGRTSRREYWMFVLVNIVIWIVLSIFTGFIGIRGIVSLLYSIAMFVFGLAIAVRRLHDTGRSGWWLLLGLVPVVNLVLIIFAALPGNPGENQYGPAPVPAAVS
jgi:uncharacterized membrane protein YhaH (DUF805 family)